MAMEDATVCLPLSPPTAPPHAEIGAAYLIVAVSRNFLKGAFYEPVTPSLAYSY